MGGAAAGGGDVGEGGVPLGGGGGDLCAGRDPPCLTTDEIEWRPFRRRRVTDDDDDDDDEYWDVVSCSKPFHRSCVADDTWHAILRIKSRHPEQVHCRGSCNGSMWVNFWALKCATEGKTCASLCMGMAYLMTMSQAYFINTALPEIVSCT